MESYLLDLANLLVRWLHLVTGIAWIGASFYFIWLDNHLHAPLDEADARRGVGGELWAIHGGGFYRAHKFKVAPPALPPQLHWFKWEAYWTWISGFAMLVLVYYVGADVYLIDREVMALDRTTAIGLGAGSLALGWLGYHGLCRSPLGRHDKALQAVLAVLLVAAAWGYCQVFSGRGAFLHFGALLGTIMVANVLFVIIPGHHEMVRAKKEERVPHPRYAAEGKQRSVHNTYFTLPVLFAMTSGHYAMTYGHRWNWLVLVGLTVVGALVRTWFVARHKGQQKPLTLVLAAIALVATAWLMAPAPAPSTAAGPVDFDAVRKVVEQRCTVCHSAQPTQAGFQTAPKGVTFDDAAQIRARAMEIRQQVIVTRVMPPGNLTGMTDEERALLARWATQGSGR